MTAVGTLPADDGVVLVIDGRRIEFASPDTRTWLDTLALQPPACWWQLIPGMLAADDADWLWQRMCDRDDHFDLDDIEDAALDALSAVLGCNFFAGQRLAAWARSSWMAFDGWAVQQGYRPLAEPISRLVNAAYVLRLQSCQGDQKAEFKLNNEVFAPPEGTRASGRSWQDAPGASTRDIDAMESSAFMAALGATRKS